MNHQNTLYRDFHTFDTAIIENISDEEFCYDIERKTGDRWIPFLSFPVTQICNFHCEYCGNGGEATASNNVMMNPNFIAELVPVAIEKGIRKFRVTGGEPFTHKEIGKILAIFNNCGCFTLINTNGSLICKNKEIIRSLNNNIKFAVSLDTLVPSKLQQISGYTRHSEILEGIRLLKECGLLFRLNMVVTKRNIDEVYDIISFCNELNCDLKLLDVVSVPVPFGNRQSIYQEISSLETDFSVKCDEILSHEYSRGFGTPCRRYKFGNTFVTIKNSAKGSHYDINGSDPICKGCPYFPCHEGLYDLFALADGRICSCRWTEKQVSENSSEQIDYLINAFKKSVFVRKRENFDMKTRLDLKKLLI